MEFASTLAGLGESTLQTFWLPLLAWTVLWMIAEIILRLSPDGHPMIRYRVTQALLLSLPLSLVAASVLDLGHLMPALPPILLEDAPILMSEGSLAAEGFSAPATTAESSSISVLPLIAGLGVILSIMLSLVASTRLAIQIVRLRRLRRRIDASSTRLEVDDLGLDGRSLEKVQILECVLDVVPMTYGLTRPTIVVPAGLSDEEKRLAIEHELIHVRHFDFAGRLAELTTQAVLLFHPATTILARRCELLREMTCDAMLTGRDIDVPAYAKLLYRFATPPAQPIAVTVSMADSRPHITRRLGAMKAAAYTSNKPYAIAFASACTVLTLISLGAAAPFAIAQASPEIIIEGRDGTASEAHPFQFTINVSGDGVELTSDHGTAWEELSFTCPAGACRQVVDYYGMVGTENENEESNLVFLLERHATTINLYGRKGTNWTVLSFTCEDGRCGHTVNQEGVWMSTSDASSGASSRRILLPTASASLMVPASWSGRLNSTSVSEGDAFAMFYHVGDGQRKVRDASLPSDAKTA